MPSPSINIQYGKSVSKKIIYNLLFRYQIFKTSPLFFQADAQSGDFRQLIDDGVLLDFCMKAVGDLGRQHHLHAHIVMHKTVIE